MSLWTPKLLHCALLPHHIWGQFWVLPLIDTGMHAIFKVGFVGDSNK